MFQGGELVSKTESCLWSTMCYTSLMGMKRCSRCGDDLPEETYAFKNQAKGWRQSACPDCLRLYRKEHYRNHPQPYKDRALANKRKVKKAYRVWLATQKCVDCGESDPVVLDADHVRGRKASGIAKMLTSGRTWEAVQKELEKCEIRCANCHRRKTAKENGWTRGSEC